MKNRKIFSESEIGKILHNKDWSQHPLGPISQWSLVLTSHINTILNSAFPMLIYWGEEGYCFYNDAFRPSLGMNGKHPSIIGIPVRDAWKENWELIEPLIAEVRKTYKPLTRENLLVPIFRNGTMEDVYWTFAYSPIIESDAEIPSILITAFETTEAVVSLKKLNESKDQLSFAIEAAELGTWNYDPINKIFTANQRFKDWFGLPDKEKIDLQDAMNAIIPSDQARVEKTITDALDSKNGGKYNILYAIKNLKTGKKLVVRSLALASFNEDQIAYRLNGTVQDVTDQYRLEKERKKSRKQLERFSKSLEKKVLRRTSQLQETNERLETSVEELQRANENLQSFAYVSSHDLQEPLRKIQMFISRLSDSAALKELPKEYDYFKRIIGSAERMRILIKDLLSFSKVGTVLSKFEYVTLDTLVHDTIAGMSENFDAEAVRIDIERDSNVRAIPYQLEQLFTNFFTNSTKFASPDRDLKITIALEPVNADSEAILLPLGPSDFHKIIYQDNGIGFKPEYNTYIFDVFKRLHTREEYPGTGIGLAIVKQIVDNHKGLIKAQGEVGKGAKFTIYLPV